MTPLMSAAIHGEHISDPSPQNVLYYRKVDESDVSIFHSEERTHLYFSAIRS